MNVVFIRLCVLTLTRDLMVWTVLPVWTAETVQTEVPVSQEMM